MRRRSVLASFLAAFLTAVSAPGVPLTAATLVVDLDGGGDYTDIQSAIDAAAPGDTVLVRAGRYVIAEPLSFNRLHDPLDPQSPPLKDIVVRSEAGPDSTTIEMSETPKYFFRAAVVIFRNGETRASTLDGFTVKGGGLMRWGSGWQEEDRGGIFCVNGSSPTIRDCRITRSSGEGVFCAASAPGVLGCEISEHAYRGLRCTRHSSVTVTGSLICRNAWGGLLFESSSATLADCAIIQNGAAAINCTFSSPSFVNCTIAGNAARTTAVIRATHESSPSFLNCIVSDNPGKAIWVDETSAPAFSFSCVEAAEPWPGDGNIDADPLFCGWPAPEVWVDAAHDGPGLGTRTDPYPSLASALGGHRPSLRRDSPCLGSGEGGADMGCASAPCGEPGSRETIVHLAPGSYAMEGYDLSFHASLRGAGEDATRIQGPVAGSRTGARIEDLAVVGSSAEGIVVVGDQAPAISYCRVAGNSGGGVFCSRGASPTLTGCTISDNSGDAGYGGAGVICHDKASPTLIDCTITRNSGVWGGGLSCMYGSSPTLMRCSITDNHASDTGGGVYCLEGSAATLVDCLISRNSADWNGGGILCESSPMTLIRCTIRENSNSGLLCRLEPSPTLVDCTIADNQTESGGGGILCSDASPLIINCVICGNRAGVDDYGGGLSFSTSSAKIVGCLIAGNSAWRGGGVTCTESSVTLLHCTIAENWARDGGALVVWANSDTSIESCILWDNTAQPIFTDGTSRLVATYSCMDPTAGLSGEGNVYADPLFVRPGRWSECEPGADPGCIEHEGATWRAWSRGDYDLRPASPAIDAAPCDAAPPDDMMGSPRPFGEGCDMGAIEHVGPRPDRFVRGDANDDQEMNIGDPIAILGFLFLGVPADLACAKSADVDDSGVIGISDAIALLGFLFLGTDPPARPFPDCGVDPTLDALDCEAFTGCP